MTGDKGNAAKQRSVILNHLLTKVMKVVSAEELAKFCTNPRSVGSHIRHLQRVGGWPIQSGQTILEMIEAGEITRDETGIEGIDAIESTDYVLVDYKADPDAARRWALGEKLRNAS